VRPLCVICGRPAVGKAAELLYYLARGKAVMLCGRTECTARYNDEEPAGGSDETRGAH